MKNDDPLEEELETTLAKLYARESDSDKYAEPWQAQGDELSQNPEFTAPLSDKKFLKCIDKTINRQRRQNFRKGIKKHRLLVMVALFVLLAVPVTAFAMNKEAVYNFFISMHGEYATIRNKTVKELYELAELKRLIKKSIIE